MRVSVDTHTERGTCGMHRRQPGDGVRAILLCRFVTFSYYYCGGPRSDTNLSLSIQNLSQDFNDFLCGLRSCIKRGGAPAAAIAKMETSRHVVAGRTSADQNYKLYISKEC